MRFHASPFLGLMLCLIAAPIVAAESVRGVVNPVSQALVSAEMRGRIVQMPYKAGEKFVAGDLLLAFDCTAEQAELAASTAERDIRRYNLKNAERLLELNATGELDVDVAGAEFRKAAALMAVQKARVSRCEIQAPYAGAVSEKLANVNEVATFNQELLRIVSNQTRDIELIVPSGWANQLKIGMEFEFLVEETGSNHNATITRIAPQVDTLSQTIKVFGELQALDTAILPGMSGMASFSATLNNADSGN